MEIALLNEISDETKLVRFVNENVMRKSIGVREGKCLKFSFPLQLVSYYQRCEGVAADPNEGSTVINLGPGKSGRVTTCNDALVSCWSVCDDLSDPWASLAGSSFADRIEHPYVLVSSVGRVKTQINKTETQGQA